jgi:hypothetical protein
VDLHARDGDPRRVREREVTLCRDRLRRHDFDLAGAALSVVVEGFLAAMCHVSLAPDWQGGTMILDVLARESKSASSRERDWWEHSVVASS